jgi:dihydrolipoamide dehydrogenase
VNPLFQKFSDFMEHFDIIVIGAGPGGYPAAIRAAQLGKSVALIEREQLGGTCLNSGCIPTKLFIGAADLYHSVLEAKKIGLNADALAFDYGRLAKHKNETVAKLRGGVGQLLKMNGVKVFTGTASFETPRQLSVSSVEKDPIVLDGDRIVLATGSISSVPGHFPKHERIVESRTFLNLAALPSRLLVIGGGYIGCELASMAARFGVQVTVVEMAEDILLTFDPDIRREVRKHMETFLGIRILTGHPLESLRADHSGVFGLWDGAELAADLALVAIGRRTVTQELQLERAGVSIDARGFVPVNDFGQTNIPTIYAVGDVNGRTLLAHAATSQGLIAAEHASGKTLDAFETLVPGVVFTSPEIGVAGLSELEAKQKGIGVRVGKFSFASLGRAIAASHTAGFAKWIVDAETENVIGAAVVGAHATELIAEAAVAIRAELKVQEIGATIHAHPTFGEIWAEAAHAVHGRAIHSPPVRK